MYVFFSEILLFCTFVEHTEKFLHPPYMDTFTAPWRVQTYIQVAGKNIKKGDREDYRISKYSTPC